MGMRDIIPIMSTPEDLVLANGNDFLSGWTMMGGTSFSLVESSLTLARRCSNHLT
jgi:hypothetical protein